MANWSGSCLGFPVRGSKKTPNALAWRCTMDLMAGAWTCATWWCTILPPMFTRCGVRKIVLSGMHIASTDTLVTRSAQCVSRVVTSSVTAAHTSANFGLWTLECVVCGNVGIHRDPKTIQVDGSLPRRVSWQGFPALPYPEPWSYKKTGALRRNAPVLKNNLKICRFENGTFGKRPKFWKKNYLRCSTRSTQKQVTSVWARVKFEKP